MKEVGASTTKRAGQTLRKAPLVASMLLAVGFVAGLSYWDEVRESVSALDDFAQEQASLAQSSATDLATRLAVIERDAQLLATNQQLRPSEWAPHFEYIGFRIRGANDKPALKSTDDSVLALSVPLGEEKVVDLLLPSLQLFGGLRQIERAGALRVLVRSPGSTAFRTTDARSVSCEPLASALLRGEGTSRVVAESAAGLGLPRRTAMAGLAHVNAGRLGHWGLVVVATAERQRDRERRAVWRLVLAVLVACGLVVAFGAVILTLQHKELALAKRLELEQLTRENDERLSRLSRAATTLTLAFGVAHELGTPLGVIVGRAEQLALKLKNDERSLKNVHSILEQAAGIHDVIRGFLNLARGGTPSFQEATAGEIVRGAAGLVQHRFLKSGVRLELDIAAAGCRLVCDLKLLEHALINLLLNACDASQAGMVVQLRVEANETFVRFLVLDEGTGIPQSIAAQVVSPFFTTKPRDRGTGLGLAIAKEIANTHRGSLSLGPNDHRGTCAILQIPYTPGATLA